MDMKRNISDLPRPILHHILSFLSQKDAVKTCVLSKSWRNLWYGRPNVVFNKDRFKGSVQKFMSVLEETLTRYTNQNLSIQQFILKMPKIDPISAQFLVEWIPILVMRNKGLETFHLRFRWTNPDKQSIFFEQPKYFDMGTVDFKSECLREIYLVGCKLNQIEKVYFRHLRILRFRDVIVEEETFERIMSSCPLIQEVSLYQCKGLKTIKVNKHNCSLKNFEVRSRLCEDTKIEIADVSSIETINIKSCPDWFEHHRNHIFTHLRSLHLSDFNVTTKSIDIFSGNFPCLEDLELSDCSTFLEEFQLSCHSIKRLAIELFGPEISITIDAPNILEFEYEGSVFPSHISFSTISNKWKSKLVLKTDLDITEMALSQWLHELDELLKVFSQSETFVHVRVQRDDDACRHLGSAYPPTREVVKHLELCLGSLCSGFSVWLEVEGKPTVKWNSKRKKAIKSLIFCS